MVYFDVTENFSSAGGNIGCSHYGSAKDEARGSWREGGMELGIVSVHTGNQKIHTPSYKIVTCDSSVDRWAATTL